MSRAKIIFITCLALIAVAAILSFREYLLLKRIQETLVSAAEASPPFPLSLRRGGAEGGGEAQAIVYAVKRSGDTTTARVRFAAFKKTVEIHPEVLRSWGSVRWKVIDDEIPALCVRNLAESTPISSLGVISGECITHIDGETVNQPMRNLGIWLTLSGRSQIRIDTLVQGRKKIYRLAKG